MIRCGQDPTDKLWADPMIGEKVRLGNRFALLNLGDVSSRYGFKGKEGMIDSMMKSGVCPSQMPKRRLIARARRDVKTTEQIWKKQLKGLQREGKLQVLLTRCLLTPILADIERNGMVLDNERVLKTYQEYAEALAEVNRELDELTGGINMGSWKQRATYLYGLVEVPTEEGDKGHVEGKTYKWVKDPKANSLKFSELRDDRGRVKRNHTRPKAGQVKRNPEGNPKTDSDTMDALASQAKTKKQRKFIELRARWGKLDAAMSKNLQFFRGVVEERTGCRFFGQFNQCNTQTHRLSSSGMAQSFELYPGKEKSVQFQNMPRVFKPLFTVRDSEYVMTEADGAQLEFRVAAFLGQDRTAIANIRDPEFDAHLQTATVMHDPEYEGEINRELYAELLAIYRDRDHARFKEVKGWRQDGKPDTFKPLYGGTKGTEAQERYYEWFQQNYHELYATQEGWVSEVLGSGRLVLPWGMRFYWDFYLNQFGTPMDKREHKSIKPSIFNYPVQSLATAEIIPIAMVYLYYRVKRAGLRVLFINTVHDSVIAEVHKDDLKQYQQLVKQAFTYDVYEYLHAVYNIDFNVPLGCEIVSGTHWSEGEEVAFNVEPPTWKEAA